MRCRVNGGRGCAAQGGRCSCRGLVGSWARGLRRWALLRRGRTSSCSGWSRSRRWGSRLRLGSCSGLRFASSDASARMRRRYPPRDRSKWRSGPPVRARTAREGFGGALGPLELFRMHRSSVISRLVNDVPVQLGWVDRGATALPRRSVDFVAFGREPSGLVDQASLQILHGEAQLLHSGHICVG